MSANAQRLDVGGSSSAERVRRELARELASGVVQAVYRLLKAAQIHALDNDAVRRQCAATSEALRDYQLRSGRPFTLLFARGAVFAAGQPLKAPRTVYEQALEIGAALERCGGGELTLAGELAPPDLIDWVARVASVLRGGRFEPPTEGASRIVLRAVDAAAVARGLELEALDDEQRIVRTYASAVVLMRGVFGQLAAENHALPRRIKHAAHSLVDLSAGNTPAFLGVTAVRNANHDDAGKAVNGAILAVAMARQITDDRVVLARIAMAAMLHDAGRPRAVRSQRLDTDGADAPGVSMALGDEAERALPAGTAAVLTAAGRVNDPTVVRSVVVYESLWLSRARWLGPLYRGLRAPTLHARIVAMARRFNELLTPSPGEPIRTASEALLDLDEEVNAAPGTGKAILGDNVDRTVLRLLIVALGVMPPGTMVELSSGEIAVVVSAGAPGDPTGLTLRTVLDDSGGMPEHPLEFTLAEAPGHVVKIVGSDPSFARRAAGDAPTSSARGGGEPAPTSPRSRPDPNDARTVIAPTSSRMRELVEAPRIVELSHLEEPDEPSAEVAASPVISAGPAGPAVRPLAPSVPGSLPRPPSAPPRPPSSRPRTHAARDVSLDDIPAPPARTADPTLTAKPPDVRGTLAATPVPHLLVHMLSRGLSGTLLIKQAQSAPHRLDFVDGAPVRLRVAQGLASLARLGELLVARGAVGEATLSVALARSASDGGSLGHRLVSEHRVAPTAIAEALRAQMTTRLTALALLPEDGEYAFYAGANAQPVPADELVACEPLAIVLGVLRAWALTPLGAPRVEATLQRLGERPVRLHPAADVSRLDLGPEELAALAAARDFDLPFTGLLEAHVAEPAVIRALVYALAILRHLDLGVADAWPYGVPRGRSGRTIATASVPPAAPPRAPAPTAASRSPAALPTPSTAPTTGPSQVRTVGAGFSERPLRPSTPTPSGVSRVAAGPVAPAPAAPPAHPLRASILARAATIASEDFFTVLGIARDSTSAELQQAFLRAAKQFHPDRLPIEVADLKEPASKIFARVAEAHQTLSDATRRAAYEAKLSGGGNAKQDAEAAEVERVLHAATQFQKAEVLLRRGDLAGAQQFAQDAHELDPEQAEHRVLLAWIQVQRSADDGGLVEPLLLLDSAIKIDPHNDRALFYRGMVHKRLGHPKEAIRDFRAAADANPKNVDAVREVRLFTMRSGNSVPPAKGQTPEKKGLRGLFKK